MSQVFAVATRLVVITTHWHIQGWDRTEEQRETFIQSLYSFFYN